MMYQVFNICSLNGDAIYTGFTHKKYIGIKYEYYKMIYNRYKSMPLNKYMITYGQKRSFFNDLR